MLLIDADNVSADVIEQAVQRTMDEYGAVHVRRAYCNAEMAVNRQALFKRLSVRPMVNLSTGKNSTDIALAVDAIDLVIAERPDVVVLVSSDSDFAPLVIRLREKGCRVCGIGQQGKTGDETVGIYDAFIDLAHHGVKPAARTAAAKKVAAKVASREDHATRASAAAAPAKKAATGRAQDGAKTTTTGRRSHRPSPRAAGLRSRRVHPGGRARPAQRQGRAAQRRGQGPAHRRPARQARQLAQAVRQAHGGVRGDAAPRPHPLDGRVRALSLPAVDWAQPWLAPYRASRRSGGAGRDARLGGASRCRRCAAPSARPTSCRRTRCPRARPTKRTSSRPAPCPRATTCTISSTASCGSRFRKPSAASTNCRPARSPARRRATRGPLRDALTLFDENGAVLDAPPALWEALVARDWHALFVTRRGLWSEARLLLFGHALLEKLVTPRKADHRARAARRTMRWPDGFRRRALAVALACEWPRNASPSCRLPVLGVPGWCADNALAALLRRSEGLPAPSVELLLLSLLYPQPPCRGRFRTQQHGKRPPHRTA
jgi:uncharacterized protein (TIGR00288 family)